MKPCLRKQLTLWAWALFLTVPGLTGWAQEPDIVETATGKTLSVSELAGRVKGADVLFFGEFHDNAPYTTWKTNSFKPYTASKGVTWPCRWKWPKRTPSPY